MMAINYEQQSEIFKALGHPTRLELAHKLREKELCVCELNAFFDIDQSTLSRHLKILKNVGILRKEKRGLQVYYALRLPCLLENILECISKLNKKEEV